MPRRGVIVGAMLSFVVAVITPVNDWLLGNTAFYSQHLPIGVLVVLLVLAFGVNPWLGRWRLDGRDLRITTAMLLVLGGVVSNGLMGYLPAIIAGPARVLPQSVELTGIPDDALPAGYYLDAADDPRAVNGFHEGLRAGEAIPWSAWIGPALAWLPLLAAGVVACLAMAALVRRQWRDHERLPYPLAEVIGGFCTVGPGGLPDLARNRVFRIAAAIAAGLILAKGLHQLGVIPIAPPLQVNAWPALRGTFLDEGYAPTWLTLSPTIYLGIVGLAFLLPAETSFSLWVCCIGGNLVWALIERAGLPLDHRLAPRVAMGGWAVEALLILWIGRRHYLALLRGAFRRGDAEATAMRPVTWAFLASAAALVVITVAAGAHLGDACVAILVYLGTGLVLARLVAEAGIPFLQTPLLASTLVYACTGVSAPASALIPLSLLGQSLWADPREHLLPFAVTADHLADQAQAPRRSWAGLALATVGGGALVAGVVMLWCAYAHDGQQAMDAWWRHGPLQSSLGPVARGEAATPADWAAATVGAGLTAGLGLARLAWSWWPLHPLGVLLAAANPMYHLWFSIALGWIAKVLVLRYGGQALVLRLRPAALGLIAGEAAVVGAFLILGLVSGLCGWDLPPTRFLPW